MEIPNLGTQAPGHPGIQPDTHWSTCTPNQVPPAAYMLIATLV